MLEWKKVCCAVDLGDESRVASWYAADVANRFGGELTLVHVVVPPPPGAGDVLVSSTEMSRVRAEEDEQTLERWRAEAERRMGRPVRSRVMRGDPVAEILRHAREEGCDLMVVGTHGRGGVARLVLGSVAERVARQSPCPVLVVHDHATLERDREREDAAVEAKQYR